MTGEIWRRRLQQLRTRARAAVPYVSGLLTALVALLLYNALVPDPPQLTARDVNDAVVQALASATPPPAYSALVFRAIQPSLVLIQTKGPDTDDTKGDGLGTGVVINDNGFVLTSLHVVANASDIILTFPDGTQSSAEVVDTQPESDIAILSADNLPDQIVPATLGNPRAMRVGDEAFAVGHPFGLYGSMSAGVISGFERTFRPSNSNLELKGLIQIDAAVNPGNSGGPLLNRDGHVIGIVVGITNPTQQEVFIGIGFAVPINVAVSGGGGSLPY